MKTEERLAVSWNERDFMTLVGQVFPEDIVIDVETLGTQGLRNENQSQLNARLVPYGSQLDLVRDQGRIVGVMRRMSREVRGGMESNLA